MGKRQRENPAPIHYTVAITEITEYQIGAGLAGKSVKGVKSVKGQAGRGEKSFRTSSSRTQAQTAVYV